MTLGGPSPDMSPLRETAVSRPMKYSCMYYNYGVSLPLSEHVDIFPVRLVSTFHRVFSVYLTLAIYLTYSSLSLRAE